MMKYKENYRRWKNFERLEIELKTELFKMTESEIEDAFHKDLEFGTGGLRALLGVGTNRLNIYTIRKSTEGFANYIESFGHGAKNKGIVIAYDNRHKSQEFAMECAKVFAKHKIKSYVFETLRPTPELSFSVRKLEAFGGIVITASHNSKEYNGYKVYNQKGSQCIPKETDEIIKYIQNVNNPLSVEVADSIELNLYLNLLSQDLDELYYEALLKVQIRPNLTKDNLKIIFSPQHGTSNIPVRTLFDRLGYDVIPVESQCNPDPDFSNTKSANPEDDIAFEAGIALALEKNGDVVITTDPDCDRLGIAIKHDDQFICLTGNQTGAILLDYILSSRVETGTLPRNGVVLQTIVTSELGKRICADYGVEVESTLTGFKYIGNKIGEYEVTKEKEFLFGYEDSYGYLIDDLARDKDAVQSSILIAEVVNYYKLRNLDLVEVLGTLYSKYGYYIDTMFSITLKGISGFKRIETIMNTFRNENLKHVGVEQIIGIEDYLKGKLLKNGIYENLNLPKSNVIKLLLKDDSWIAIRPSGTEPKCKFYYCIKSENSIKARNRREYLHKCILNMIDAREEINLKKALITGITGQDGSYLAEMLLEKGYEVHGVIRRASTFNTKRIDHLMNDESIYNKKLFIHHGDMTDSSNINRLIEKIRPDEIYNLAAQSHVKVSFDVPEFTADTDALGVLRMLDAIKESGIQCRFYQASTSELFGGLPETAPQNEDTPLYPKSPYGVAKLYGYWITVNYRESYGVYACNGILFNHESPRRGETFVTRKITMAVANIVAGKQEKLVLGNMDAKRDWGYAKDYVEAMWLMLQQDEPKDFVIATNETHTVREFVELSFAEVGIIIKWQGESTNEIGIDASTGKVLVSISENYFRPAEVDLLWGDSTRAEAQLKWERKTSFKELVSLMVNEDMKEIVGIGSEEFKKLKKVKV